MKDMRILTVGDCAVSVEFGQEISLEINHKVMALKMVLERETIRGIVELIPTYCSLLIQYDPMDLRYGQLRDRLEALVTQLDEVEMPPKQVVEIPVAYGGEYGPDLGEVARAHNISEE
ncbi:MAG: carboxyltransferase domain-containing protein, partial [Anaerovibrio sp.]|nr:carboxyltransferase domain-containing protein [Anaerovibrio sp.]